MYKNFFFFFFTLPKQLVLGCALLGNIYILQTGGCFQSRQDVGPLLGVLLHKPAPETVVFVVS